MGARRVSLSAAPLLPLQRLTLVVLPATAGGEAANDLSSAVLVLQVVRASLEEVVRAEASEEGECAPAPRQTGKRTSCSADSLLSL